MRPAKGDGEALKLEAGEVVSIGADGDGVRAKSVYRSQAFGGAV